MESGTSRTKHAASCPLDLPALTRHGVLGMNSRASITSLIAAKNLSRFSPVSAIETCPTTRRTISAHSSSGRPFASFSEYRLLTTFLTLIPSCCDLRRGDMAGEPPVLFPVLPIAALLINLCLSNGEPEGRLAFQKRLCQAYCYAGLNLECVLDLLVGSFRSPKPGQIRYLPPRTRREYTPLKRSCQPISCGYFFVRCYRV